MATYRLRCTLGFPDGRSGLAFSRDSIEAVDTAAAILAAKAACALPASMRLLEAMLFDALGMPIWASSWPCADRRDVPTAAT